MQKEYQLHKPGNCETNKMYICTDTFSPAAFRYGIFVSFLVETVYSVIVTKLDGELGIV